MPFTEADIEAQRNDTAQHLGGRAGVGPRREAVGLGPAGTAPCCSVSGAFFSGPVNSEPHAIFPVSASSLTTGILPTARWLEALLLGV